MGQIPKMNPEGFEIAAKVWNDRYVELSKIVAADQEKQAKHVQLLADEIQSLQAEKADLIAAVKAVLRHEMETDQPFRQPYHGLMQALVNVTGSDDLGESK